MTDYYYRTSDGLDTDTGLTWALAWATISYAAANVAAGDRIFAAAGNAESLPASHQTWAFPNTQGTPVQVISADDTSGEPPSTYSRGAGISGANGSYLYTINGCVEFYGFDFDTYSAIINSRYQLANSAGGGDQVQLYRDCTWYLGAGGSASYLLIGNNGNNTPCEITFEDNDVTFTDADNSLYAMGGWFRWIGGVAYGGTGTYPPSLLELNSQNEGARVFVSGVDMSDCLASMDLIQANTYQMGVAVFRGCRLPSSWTGSLCDTVGTGLRAEMYECASDTATYGFRIADAYGNAYDESTLVKSGTSFTLQSTDLSLKMVSTALATEGQPFISQTFSLYNTATGSSKTLTIPILHDSVTNLQDDEIWVRARYLGNASYPLATEVTDRRAGVLTSPADQTADSSTWTTTGMSNPNKQKLSVSFTPQLEGVIEFEICLGKPSYTVYCDIPAALT